MLHLFWLNLLKYNFLSVKSNNKKSDNWILLRMWSNVNSHSLLVGMQNATAILEDSLVVSYKTKHTLTI